MVEMLGVLAIIGVLSVAGIAGYTGLLCDYRTQITEDLKEKLQKIQLTQGNDIDILSLR